MSTAGHSSDVPRARRFPAGFVWGVGTSSYQIEGAVAADGRGRSIWDVFAHADGNVHRGDTGDTACDSYNRMDDDVRLLDDLGVGAYRFSISWPRVLPQGAGPINQAGLDYYRRLVERLNQSGIKPVATVYHWDLPQALEDRGGWARRDTAERMAELTQVLAQALGDQVGMWATINEPLQSVHQGYRMGTHAPGRCDDEAAAAAIHHLLLAHGYALQALRATVPAGIPIGPTMDPQPFVALDDAAAPVADALDALHNRVYLDPVLRGSYPFELRSDMRPTDELIKDGDMELISAPIDFFGVNYYRPHYIRSGDWSDLRLGETPVPEHPGFVHYLAPDLDRTVMGWPIVPESLRDLLLRLHADSGGLPLYVTENGCAADDYVTPAGTIEDHDRIAYIHSHLEAVLEAIDAGVNVAGYFCWSLMDNFEWAEGYRRRFGLHYVEFESGRRIPKRSAHFYRQLTRSSELPPLVPSPASDGVVPGAQEAAAAVS
ncbi:MAG TPA: GH1 family beta-glucosidase [Solirubrobacteraceae bacterium]|nr:GH1 family beta-glucosidase [Solirubrobacteraceae bacterium]